MTQKVQINLTNDALILKGWHGDSTKNRTIDTKSLDQI
jgi:hypothetical protein